MAQILVLSATPRPFLEDHGGKQRLVRLLYSLAKKHEVTLLSLSWHRDQGDEIVSNNLRHITVPVEGVIVKKLNTRVAGISNANQDILTGFYKRHLKNYKIKMNQLASDSDIIVVDHYATAPMVEYLQNKSIPIFYSSQNCETHLAEQLYSKKYKDIDIIKDTEKFILKAADSFSYCSKDDLDILKKYFILPEKSFYIPNGTVIPKIPMVKKSSNNIIFIGSGHPPNNVAAKKIVEVAKNNSKYDFTIAGSCARFLHRTELPPNVKTIPEINNEEVDNLFLNAFAFINPMESGSGTHLKMMKALSYGLPIISSSVGARGFSDEEIKNCMIICDDNNEISEAIEALNNKKIYRAMMDNAIKESKKYSWDIVGDSFCNAIEQTLSQKSSVPKRERKEKILVYSIIRNERRYMKKYYVQLKQMVETHPEYEFFLSIYENDSTDGTREAILKMDWSFFSDYSIITEDLKTKDFGSVKDGERVKNLSIARNKAIEAKGFLKEVDYVMMVESDMEFDNDAVSQILNFKNIEPNFDIVSGITIRNNWLYDQWATRSSPVYIANEFKSLKNISSKPYAKYYSTSNGICLYRAKPFQEGVRYGWINTVTGEPDCDTVVVCQNFHDNGYSNIYVLHDAKIYHEHK